MKAGAPIQIKIDTTLTQDATGTMTYLQLEALGIDKVKTLHSVSYVDHNTLQNGFMNADDHKFLQTVANKYGIIFLIVSMMFSIALTSIVCAAYKPHLDEPLKFIEPYQDYIDYANENGGGYTGSPSGYSEAIDEYKAAMSMIRAEMTFWIMFPSLCMSLAFGLLADCIYRRYVMKNYRYKEGGVSGWSFVGGIIVYLFFSNVIVSPITTYIATLILK
jgi:hypothetical protein